MVEPFEFGNQLREFLRGVLALEGPERGPYLPWGPRIDHEGLLDLYAPQEIKPFTAVPGGIDNLHLQATDTFSVPGRGEFTVEFKGYMRVARSHPTTDDWDTREVTLNLLDLKLHGESKEMGPITVRLNPEIVAAGQIFPSGAPVGTRAAAACRIAVAAVFELPTMGFTASPGTKGGLFNKEPIVLVTEGATSIPPVENPNGSAILFRLPLYHQANPRGKPVAYLNRLEYTIGDYVTREEAEELRRL